MTSADRESVAHRQARTAAAQASYAAANAGRRLFRAEAAAHEAREVYAKAVAMSTAANASLYDLTFPNRKDKK